MKRHWNDLLKTIVFFIPGCVYGIIEDTCPMNQYGCNQRCMQSGHGTGQCAGNQCICSGYTERSNTIGSTFE